MNCQESLPAQYPWAERTANYHTSSIVQPNPLEDFLKMPFPSAVLGAAVYTGQSALLANTRILLHDGLNGDERRLRTKIVDFITLCQQQNICEYDLYMILFYLMIEPFALMNQHDTAQIFPKPFLPDDSIKQSI